MTAIFAGARTELCNKRKSVNAKFEPDRNDDIATPPQLALLNILRTQREGRVLTQKEVAARGTARRRDYGRFNSAHSPARK